MSSTSVTGHDRVTDMAFPLVLSVLSHGCTISAMADVMIMQLPQGVGKGDLELDVSDHRLTLGIPSDPAYLVSNDFTSNHTHYVIPHCVISHLVI